MTRPLAWPHRILWMLVAAASFHLAYFVPALAFLIGVYLFALLQLSRQPNRFQAMNTGWLLALLVYAPHLFFFWSLFGPASIALWLVLGFWLGLFLALVRFVRERHGEAAASWLAPPLWLALEYFRSELYPLRFSWLNAGYAFAWTNTLPAFAWLGMYGIGLGLMTGASIIARLPARRAMLVGTAGLGLLAAGTHLPRGATMPRPGREVRVAGLQLEFPDAAEIPGWLDRLQTQHPEAELYVLSEYTFQDAVPDAVKAWCRQRQKYLLVGGKEHVAADQFFNTAYVVGPSGEVVFQQAKAQPIQFFKDGLPAVEQRVWDSPWGRLGVCICYDLSYTRVIDALARQGAQALLVPTMDVEDWGPYEHRLHARVAPMRACEYRIPVFRLASSGISQVVAPGGERAETIGFPGSGEMLAGTLHLTGPARLPADRWFVWPALLGAAVIAARGFWLALWDRSRRPARGRLPPARACDNVEP